MYWIVGKNGQLSTSLQKEFQKRGVSFLVTSSKDVDVTKKCAIENFLFKNEIDYIINCSAFTAVDIAENKKKEAFFINRDGVRNLAEASAKANAHLLHFSTDFVFSGRNLDPYVEDSEPKPLNIYGKSKLSGEKEVFKYSNAATIIRVSWLYSPYGKNFVKTIVRLAKERESINVVNDQVGSPTSALKLAEFLADNIIKMAKLEGVHLFHFSDKASITWFDFAKEIVLQSKLSCKVEPILSSEFETLATRPSYSVMSTTKIEASFGNIKGSWRESLSDVLSRIET